MSKGAFAAVVLSGAAVTLVGCGTQVPISSGSTRGASSSPGTRGQANNQKAPDKPESTNTGINSSASESNSQTPPPTSTGNTVSIGNSASFPQLIRSAMQPVVGHTSVPLYAPIYYPGMIHSPLPISTQTYQSDYNNTAPYYQVILTRGGQEFGAFSVAKFPQNPVASSSLTQWASISTITLSTANPSSISLGYGIVATTGPVANLSSASDAILWKEGRWQMAVLFTQSSYSEATYVAKRIVRYLHSSFMPVPQTKGFAVTTLTPNPADGYKASVIASWSEWYLGFYTRSNGPWNSNLSGGYLSALAMAICMRPY